MRVLITGATGYVGQHIVPRLLAQNHEVIAVARSEAGAKRFNWYKNVAFIANDLHINPNIFTSIEGPIDALIHLAWPDLPNYQQSFHLTKNLPSDIRFFEEALNFGVRHLIVAGTCLEYGMQSGGISEDSQTNPVTPYGLAKDTLRKWLQQQQAKNNFTLQWMRLFYSYGVGQSEKSLLSQLDKAITGGDDIFNMSGGEQLRDYLSVDIIADYFVNALSITEIEGVINCCSGQPIKILDLVRRHCQLRNSKIALNMGHYPYLEYEPLYFWGIPEKIKMFKKH